MCNSDTGWWLTCDEHQEVIFRSVVTECPICVAEARAYPAEGGEELSFIYNCENCGQKLEVPQELVDHSIECPICTATLGISDGEHSDANNNASKSIYCTNCGEDLEIPRDVTDQELECPNCGIELNVPKSGHNSGSENYVNNYKRSIISTPTVELPIYEPNNYLPYAILVTIFCCFPFGIVSIVFATQVKKLHGEGKIQEAVDSSKNAKMWAWITFVLGLIYLPIINSLILN
jgi:predicted nucleic acid-binding Zn ribbon protein